MTKSGSQRELAKRYLENCTEYSDPYEHEKLVRDWEKKVLVAQNVVGDFKRRAGDPSGKKIFDLGFGNGQYAIAFSKAGAHVAGLEVNAVLRDIALENVKGAGVQSDLRVYDGTTMPFSDGEFDFAYSISVLEHVSDAAQAMKEVARVLKPGGRFYLALPNRIDPKETHTGIWFLSFFPRDFAQFLLRSIWKRNTIEEINLHFIGYFRLRRLAREAGMNILLEVEGAGLRGVLKKVLAKLGLHHSAILGTIMVVLEKPSNVE